MSDKILLFIPMYNCEKQIVRVLAQLDKEITQYLYEVIIVNNRSTDNGEMAVETYLKEHEFPIKISLLCNTENYGLGGSHKVAFNYAIDNGFDYVITLHGDDQGNIADLLPLFNNRKYQEFDCCLGARFMQESKLEGYSKFRTFGNKVYNGLFSICTGRKIYDLGSGLNMYKVEMLKNGFYEKYNDNLVFNYLMIMGASYFKHTVSFFPITWREEDQISNVKMVNQAITVLKLLFTFVIAKKRFIHSEHRDKIIDRYSADVVFSNMQN